MEGSRSFTHTQLWSFTDITRSAGGWSIWNWQQLPITRNSFRNTRQIFSWPRTHHVWAAAATQRNGSSPSLLDSGGFLLLCLRPPDIILVFWYFLFYLDSEDISAVWPCREPLANTFFEITTWIFGTSVDIFDRVQTAATTPRQSI